MNSINMSNLSDDAKLCFELFESCLRYKGKNPEKCNIKSYAGKHIIERNRRIREPCDEKDFIKLMDILGVQPFRSKVGAFVYPIRLKKEYKNLWKSK